MFGAPEFDPTKERGRAADRRAGRGTGRSYQAGRSLRCVERDGMGRLRIPSRVARGQGRARPRHDQNSYSLVSRGVDNDLAEVLFRQKMSLLAYSPPAVACSRAIVRLAARGLALRAVRRYRPAVQKPIVHEAVAAYATIAKQAGLTTSSKCVGLCRSRWHLGAVIIARRRCRNSPRTLRGAGRLTPRRSRRSRRSISDFQTRQADARFASRKNKLRRAGQRGTMTLS